MRVIVAGCAGFIGSVLALRLLNDGHEVIGVDNLTTGQMGHIETLGLAARFQFIKADIADPFPVDPPVDWILHLASPASPLDYGRYPLETLKANSEGTRQLLDLAARMGTALFFASTSEVYGVASNAAQPEDYWGNVNPIGPRSAYAEAKRFGEALVTAYAVRLGLKVRIARLFNVYGPGMRLDDGRVTVEFMRRALQGDPLEVHGRGDQVRCLTYVDDAVDGILAVIAGAEARPVNLGDPAGLVSILELARRVCGIAGGEVRIVHLPERPEDPMVRVPVIDRARSLGWKPRMPLEEGLRQTYEWFAEAQRS